MEHTACNTADKVEGTKEGRKKTEMKHNHYVEEGYWCGTMRR